MIPGSVEHTNAAAVVAELEPKLSLCRWRIHELNLDKNKRRRELHYDDLRVMSVWIDAFLRMLSKSEAHE